MAAKYRVKTDQGTFEVILDREPESPEQLRSLVEQQLRGGGQSVTGKAGTLYQRGARRAADVLGQLIGGGPDYPLPGGYVSPEAQAVGTGLARLLIPQTEIELGALIGTGGASALPVKGGKAVATRILGGAGGGELGGLLAGERPGEGAVVGGGGATVGELLAPVGGKIARSLPGAKERINRADAAKLGDIINQEVPALGRPQTPADLQALALDPRRGRYLLGDYLEQKTSEAAGWIANRQMTVPSLSAFPMTLSEAVEKLKQAGYAGYGGGKRNVLTRTLSGKASRELWTKAIGEIEGELVTLDATGAALAAFRDGRRQFSVGTTLLEILRHPQVFIGRPNQIELSMPRLQMLVSRNRGLLTQRLGDVGFRELERMVYRGGAIGTRDIAAPLRGQSTDVLMQTFGRGEGGSAQVLSTGPRMFLPNLGTQYTGRPPYTLSLSAQTALDMALQKLGAEGLRQYEQRR